MTNHNEEVNIKRRGVEDVALISASERTGLLETRFLLRSPANVERLLTAYTRALKKNGEPQSLAQLKEEVGFDPE